MDDRSKCLVGVTLELRGGPAPCMGKCDVGEAGLEVMREPMTMRLIVSVCVCECVREKTQEA